MKNCFIAAMEVYNLYGYPFYVLLTLKTCHCYNYSPDDDVTVTWHPVDGNRSLCHSLRPFVGSYRVVHGDYFRKMYSKSFIWRYK